MTMNHKDALERADQPGYRLALLACALLFLGAVIGIAYVLRGRLHFENPCFFWPFALLPGLVGTANYIVAHRQRIAEEAETMPAAARHSIVPSVSASILLIAVFLIIPIAEADPLLVGLVYAGYGAYVSTLWFMLVRMNANVLSPRFLLNSAIKASLAMIIGYLAGTAGSKIGIDNSKTAGEALYFLIGLFHPLAMKRLRALAVTTFGVAAEGAADLSVRMIEGIDEGAADTLEEMGITSVQHLATRHTDDVCAWTLYPSDRILDWIDQSILMLHSNGRIADLRAAGIRSAHSLMILRSIVNNHDHEYWEAANERFVQVAQRLGLTKCGLHLIGECIDGDPGYKDLAKEYENRGCKAQQKDPERGSGSTAVASPSPETLPIAKQGPTAAH